MTRRRSASIVGSLVIAASLVGIGSVQAAAPKPDLVVTSVAWAPSQLVGGQNVTFRATIRNQGAAATPAGVIHGVGFQVDGTLVTWSDTWKTPLQPGQTVTVEANGGRRAATWSAAPGAHSINAYVDDAQRISESVEGNNQRSRTVTITTGIASRLISTGDGLAAASTVPARSYYVALGTVAEGSLYGACFNAPPGARRQQIAETEKWLTDTIIGDFAYPIGHNNAGRGGTADVLGSDKPTQVVSDPLSFGIREITHLQSLPSKLTCPAGSQAELSRFHLQRYTTKANDTGNTVHFTATAVVDLEVSVP